MAKYSQEIKASLVQKLSNSLSGCLVNGGKEDVIVLKDVLLRSLLIVDDSCGYILREEGCLKSASGARIFVYKILKFHWEHFLDLLDRIISMFHITSAATIL